MKISSLGNALKLYELAFIRSPVNSGPESDYVEYYVRRGQFPVG